MKEAILLTDGYKLDHRRQYPENTEEALPDNVKVIEVV